ncbi:MAG TPA: hypothetical protein VMU06_24375 [Stellaceae bacterium]|nr:hypothetical protein [Stellaceae bacterium]
MELDLARHIAAASYRATAELTALLDAIKIHGKPEEYEAFRRAIATCVATIGTEVIDRALREHPDLDKEIEQRVRKFGFVV